MREVALLRRTFTVRPGFDADAYLGKAWGITREWTIHGLMVSSYYTVFEGLYFAHTALHDVLEHWEDHA